MTDLGWRADGIERARAAGGIELELYRRPGFTGGKAVRRSTEGGGGAGFEISETDGYAYADPEPFDARRCR
jgi:hypothetical protein